MSLLMDALKKAELAKRQGQGEGTGDPTAALGTGEWSLKPLTEPDFTDSKLGLPEADIATPDAPAQSSHLEELDARFLAEAELAAAARLKGAQPVAPAQPPAVSLSANESHGQDAVTPPPPRRPRVGAPAGANGA